MSGLVTCTRVVWPPVIGSRTDSAPSWLAEPRMRLKVASTVRLSLSKSPWREALEAVNVPSPVPVSSAE